MKTPAAIAVTALLAVLALTPGPSAAAASADMETCDASNFPNALVWLKVKETDCDTGKSITAKMRRYMQNHQGVGATDENGYFHHTILEDWHCRARFVGGDEVIEGCRNPIPHTKRDGLIKAFFYID